LQDLDQNGTKPGPSPLHPNWRQENTVPTTKALTRVKIARPIMHKQNTTLTTRQGINPLMASATSLFAFINKLNNTLHYEDIAGLHRYLTYELQAFEHAATGKGYHQEIILIARYTLCATLDDIIINTVWGHEKWQDYRLLQNFPMEMQNCDRFYLILEKMLEDGQNYIDIIELMYLCINLGFLGPYGKNPYYMQDIDSLKERCYGTIRRIRGEISPELCQYHKYTNKDNQGTVAPHKKHLSIILIVLLSITIMATIYIGFNYFYTVTVAPLYQDLNSLETNTPVHNYSS